MSFAARLTRHPIPHDREAGAEAAAALPGLDPALCPLVEGAAGCSPFLKDLMRREADWLPAALSEPPETVLAGVLDAPSGLAPAALGPALRQAKRRVALLAGLADLGGVWTLEQVTGALTALADRATHLAVTALVAEEIRRGKLPSARPEDAATGAGMVVLAMGKMGAAELNYSSDIDLICLFDETRFDRADFHEARAAFIRVTRRMTALLSDRTGEGYVFRTDLRLRPDPAVTPVCLAMEAAERYYESLGRTWERAAYIKARPCAGDLAAGERFLRALVPFVWRKHLDFAAIQDAHDMRLRIRDHKGLHGPVVLEGHNMKLGQGGIRDIEFFTQTRQIIAGGRDADLRVRGTVEGLARLADKGWVPQAVTDELTGLYRAHRETEHRLQMIADAQTHALPGSAEGFDRLARFCGEADTAAFRHDLRDRLARVAGITEGFFAPDAPPTPRAAPEATLSDHARGIVEGWPRYPVLRTDRAMASFRRLQPRLLALVARAADTEAAIVQFDGFLRGLPAGVQLFALFEANPQLVEMIVDICATAPRLAQYLSRNAGVFDAVIGGDFFAPWPGRAALARMLGDRLEEFADYEARLDGARRWAKEWHFRIGVHHLRGLIDGFEAARQYADLAEAVVAGLWPSVVAEFARKHGPPPGRGAVVLGMGSLGAGRLNAGSDLDLILIYDAAGAEASDGPRPLTVTVYFARLTKALVLALSAQTAEGRLYEVDMRLRPSGRQGPVATAMSAFRSYQTDEAWTWEHLALTRARAVAGSAELGAEVETFRRALLREKADRPGILPDVAEMRARLRAAKPGAAWEVKDGAGRIMDIELLAQAAALKAADPARGVEMQLRAGRRIGWLDTAAEAELARSYRLFWSFHAAARLLADGPLDPGRLGDGGCAVLLRETGQAEGGIDGLAARLAEAGTRAVALIDALVGPAPDAAPHD